MSRNAFDPRRNTPGRDALGESLLPGNSGHRQNLRRDARPGTWRLLAPALAMWLLAACGVGIPGSGAVITVVASVVGIAAGAVALRRKQSRRWMGTALLSCAIVLILGIRIMDGESLRSAPELEQASEQRHTLELDVELADYVSMRIGPSSDRFWVRAKLSSGPSTPLLLWLPETPELTWGPGTQLHLLGIPQKQGPADSVAFTVSVIHIETAGPQQPAIAEVSFPTRVRTALREAAAQMTGAELIPGFAVGDTALLSEELDRAMKESSLTHVTAVSGANCALVTGAVIWLASRLGAGRRIRIVIAACALLGFVTLVGPDSSVQRAAVMASVMLVSGFGGKRSVALPALGVAILVLIVGDPWQSVQPGFVLSVAATAGILLMATPVSTWLKHRLRIPGLLALPIAVASVAQFACGPFLLLLQPGLPMIGVLANVIAAPAVPLATGLGLCVALTAYWNAEIAQALLWLARIPAQWVSGTAEITSRIPFARWYWPEGWWGFALLAGSQLLMVIAWALWRGHVVIGGRQQPRGRSPWEQAPPMPRRLRLSLSITGALALALPFGTTVMTPITERLSAPQRWQIVMCDVGQGDAFLLRHPATPDEIMLVDTGDDDDALRACLERFEIGRIALLVLSHDDQDHVGALASIIHRVDAAIIAPTVVGERTEQREVVRILSEGGVDFQIAAGGARSQNQSVDHGLTWRVLAPRQGEPPDDSNASSLIMRVELGSMSVLLLGDSGEEEHVDLLRSEADITADVMKVAHHGSSDQYGELLSRSGARWFLVSVGAENRYGHPAPSVLARIEAMRGIALRSDELGAVALDLDELANAKVWHERGSVVGAL